MYIILSSSLRKVCLREERFKKEGVVTLYCTIYAEENSENFIALAK